MGLSRNQVGWQMWNVGPWVEELYDQAERSEEKTRSPFIMSFNTNALLGSLALSAGLMGCEYIVGIHQWTDGTGGMAGQSSNGTGTQGTGGSGGMASAPMPVQPLPN